MADTKMYKYLANTFQEYILLLYYSLGISITALQNKQHNNIGHVNKYPVLRQLLACLFFYYCFHQYHQTSSRSQLYSRFLFRSWYIQDTVKTFLFHYNFTAATSTGIPNTSTGIPATSSGIPAYFK